MISIVGLRRLGRREGRVTAASGERGGRGKDTIGGSNIVLKITPDTPMICPLGGGGYHRGEEATGRGGGSANSFLPGCAVQRPTSAAVAGARAAPPRHVLRASPPGPRARLGHGARRHRGARAPQARKRDSAKARPPLLAPAPGHLGPARFGQGAVPPFSTGAWALGPC
jgi:hypothetical protein